MFHELVDNKGKWAIASVLLSLRNITTTDRYTKRRSIVKVLGIYNFGSGFEQKLLI